MAGPPEDMTKTPGFGRTAFMDALSDVLRVAHLTGGVFMHADFFAPWCMAARVAPEHCSPALGAASHLIPYHYILEGELNIRVDGEDGEGLVLAAGEVVLLPRNDLHLVGSEAVRRYAEALPQGQTGWLAGLRDPHVARALALLHGDITRPWNVDDLSREVGLSRSALADHFIRLIGVPPINYLANSRMQVATQKLRSTSASLAQIADMVGYGSEAAFSRAFKKSFGSAPATWQRSNS